MSISSVLQQAETYLRLLEQLVLMQNSSDQAPTLKTLRHALEQIEAVQEEHRRWRYQYYYESLDTRRMVQSRLAINNALAHFNRMRTNHGLQLSRLRSLLHHLQRPDPALTSVAVGDLWVMTEFALSNLTGFDDYMQSLAPVS